MGGYDRLEMALSHQCLDGVLAVVSRKPLMRGRGLLIEDCSIPTGSWEWFGICAIRK